MLAFTVQFSRYGRSARTRPPSGDLSARPCESVALSEAAASSGPNSVPGTSSVFLSSFRFPRRGKRTNRTARENEPNNQCSTRKHGRPVTRSVTQAPVLLRKEVIQPHLPVRLPCYDFVPIADPTFDSSLPYGLGRRLRVLPTFVT